MTRRLFLTALVASSALVACSRNPANPDAGPLAIGRWAGDGACLSIDDAACDLAVGCGHGHFTRPVVRADGTFEVDGTYRIEVGPISIEPAPPAHFSGVVTGSRLILRIVPTASLAPASYTMTTATAGTCPRPCV